VKGEYSEPAKILTQDLPCSDVWVRRCDTMRPLSSPFRTSISVLGVESKTGAADWDVTAPESRAAAPFFPLARSFLPAFFPFITWLRITFLADLSSPAPSKMNWNVDPASISSAVQNCRLVRKDGGLGLAVDDVGLPGAGISARSEPSQPSQSGRCMLGPATVGLKMIRFRGMASLLIPLTCSEHQAASFCQC